MNRGTLKRSLRMLANSGLSPRKISNLALQWAMPMPESGKLPWLPYAIDIEPTTRCNLRCPMCLHSYWKREERDLKPADFDRMLCEIPTLIKIKLQGIGEPLLSEHFFECLDVAERHGVSVHTISNGTTLTDKNIGRICNSSLAEFQVSLDSADKTLYERIRVGAKQEDVISKLERLCRHPQRGRLGISVWATVWKDSQASMPALTELCCNFGIDSLFINFGMNNWGEEEIERNIGPQRPEMNASLLEIAERCKSSAKKAGMKLLVIFPPEKPFSVARCPWPKHSVFISCDGFVTPCCAAVAPDRFNFGNILSQPFEEIWNSPAYAAFRKAAASGAAPQPCRRLCKEPPSTKGAGLAKGLGMNLPEELLRPAQRINLKNVLAQALKPQRFSVMLGKLRKRIFDPKGSIPNEESLAWIKAHCSDFASYASSLDSRLWQESLQAAERIDKHATEVLKKIDYDLGGGGVYPLLYFFTRYTRPEHVIETGVAAGFSSYAFLLALKANGAGTLHSSDFPYFRLPNPERYIGVVIEDNLREGWDLRIEGDEINLPGILQDVKAIDLFHYDSDKSYSGREFALEQLEPKLSPDAILFMDDIQDNPFFFDYVKSLESSGRGRPWRIFEFAGKYIGMLGEPARRTE